MLLLTVLGLVRLAWSYRGAMLSIDRAVLRRFARAASVAAVVSALMLSPVLYAAAIPLAFWWQWISLGLYVVGALLWLIPDRRIENVLRSADTSPRSGADTQ